MLKGINIGGDNRLEYLDFLNKKQDENIEMIEKFYINEDKKNNKNKDKEKYNNDNNNDINNKDNRIINGKNNDIDNEPLINKEENLSDNNIDEEENNNEDIINNTNINYGKKFDEESEYIENESSFYNFDENLLQYRPLEIEHLIKVLIE